MKQPTKLLLEIVRICEEREWEYTIDKGEFYIMLGNMEFEVSTKETAKLSEILDLIITW